MKKYILIGVVLLCCITHALAGNPITNPFYLYNFGTYYFPDNSKEYVDFQLLCNTKKFTPKQVAKVRAAYEHLCNTNAKYQAAAMCLLGHYFLSSENNEELYKEGVSLLATGLKQMPDTSVIDGGRKKELKEMLMAIHHQLGYAYIKGLGSERNYELAYNHYLAEGNQRKFHSPLALCYFFGLGTPVDLQSAIKATGDFSYAWNRAGYVITDMELLQYSIRGWNKEQQIDSTAFLAFREGYLKWHLEEDFDEAKECFQKSIDMGYLPAMCELAMLNLDKRWKKRNEKDFEPMLKEAADLGFLPANHIIGRKILEQWGESSLFSYSAQGKALPYFIASAKDGYLPSIAILKEYDNGTYSDKTGLSAAFAELKDTWKMVNGEGPGLLESILLIGENINDRLDFSANTDNSNKVVSPSANSSVDGSNTSSFSGNTLSSNGNGGVVERTNNSSVSNTSNKRKCVICGGDGNCYTTKGVVTEIYKAYCRGDGKCHACGGTGRLPAMFGSTGYIRCTYCAKPLSQHYGNGICGKCHGTGKCHRCNGKGYI